MRGGQPPHRQWRDLRRPRKRPRHLSCQAIARPPSKRGLVALLRDYPARQGALRSCRRDGHKRQGRPGDFLAARRPDRAGTRADGGPLLDGGGEAQMAAMNLCSRSSPSSSPGPVPHEREGDIGRTAARSRCSAADPARRIEALAFLDVSSESIVAARELTRSVKELRRPRRLYRRAGRAARSLAEARLARMIGVSTMRAWAAGQSL